jgi:hypothetical protein
MLHVWVAQRLQCCIAKLSRVRPIVVVYETTFYLLKWQCSRKFAEVVALLICTQRHRGGLSDLADWGGGGVVVGFLSPYNHILVNCFILHHDSLLSYPFIIMIRSKSRCKTLPVSFCLKGVGSVHLSLVDLRFICHLPLRCDINTNMCT